MKKNRGGKFDGDEYEYHIPEKVIRDSEKVFREYALLNPPNEGLVYWAGVREKKVCTILCVIAPKTRSHYGGVYTSHQANFKFVKVLARRELIQIAQVHTHPGGWVGHSEGDSRCAAFKVSGLLSFVVPNYSKNGMLPLNKCGIHQFWDGSFVRLSNAYVRGHFFIQKHLTSNFEDLR